MKEKKQRVNIKLQLKCLFFQNIFSISVCIFFSLMEGEGVQFNTF